jgi:hypothetical protein
MNMAREKMLTINNATMSSKIVNSTRNRMRDTLTASFPAAGSPRSLRKHENQKDQTGGDQKGTQPVHTFIILVAGHIRIYDQKTADRTKASNACYHEKMRAPRGSSQKSETLKKMR